MKIQSIQNCNSKKSSQAKGNYNSSTMTTSFNSKDSYSPSFGIGVRGALTKHMGEEILKCSHSELLNHAEKLHKRSEVEISGLSRVEPDLLNDFAEVMSFGFYKDKDAAAASKKAYEKLSSAIKGVINDKLNMTKRISELETKKATGFSNYADQIERVGREFIDLISEEKNGRTPTIKNGILIHGGSKEKEDFINQVAKMSEAFIKRFKHDENNPAKTIDSMIDIAESSEKAFKHSNTRTILIIDDLDKLLTNKNTESGMDLIGEFKGFVEDISRKYHVTIITKTDTPLDKFEPATIASHRLGMHINLKEGFTTENSAEIARLKAEIKRLDDVSKDKDIYSEYALYVYH